MSTDVKLRMKNDTLISSRSEWQYIVVNVADFICVKYIRKESNENMRIDALNVILLVQKLIRF